MLKISKYNIKSLALAFYLAGVFVTMPILTINFFGRLISIFSLLFALLYASVFITAVKQGGEIRLNHSSTLLATWFIMSLISSLAGAIYFIDELVWFKQSLSYVPKILLYLSLLLLLVSVNNHSELKIKFVKGFITGCMLNLVWSVFEGFSFYLYDVALNDIVFADYLNALPEEIPNLTLIRDGIIRAAGFNYDPAHLGGIIPIVFIYGLFKRNILILLLAVFSLIFSASTTAFVTCVIVLAINIKILNVFKFKLITQKFKNKNAAWMFMIISIFASVTLVANIQLLEGVSNNINGFFTRANETYIDNQDRGPRYVYHAYLLEAMANSGFGLLTGTGFGTGSHPYVSDSKIIAKLDSESYYPYDPESTYISYLFDVGIFGLLLYFVILSSQLLKYRRMLHIGDTEIIIYSTLCSMFVSGLFYHYTFVAYHILILIFAVSSRNTYRIWRYK